MSSPYEQAPTAQVDVVTLNQPALLRDDAGELLTDAAGEALFDADDSQA